MRFVIGEAGDDYARRLRRLVAFFTEARFLRDDLVLAVVVAGEMAAVANINRPRSESSGLAPGEDPLEPHRQDLWNDLGREARARYEAYGAAAGLSSFPEPHYHLGMIGARRRCAGQGHAGRLLNHLHDLSESHASSLGVSLATENPRNITLYEHFGYRIVSREVVGDGLETWGFFRENQSGGL